MFDAIDSICLEMLALGNKMDDSKLKAFALLSLGELISTQENDINVEPKVDIAIQRLLEANELYR